MKTATNSLANFLRPNSSKTNRPNTATTINSATINPDRREKLKSLIFEKYKKKYGKLFPEKEVKTKIESFFAKEKITEKELKELDKNVENLVMEIYNKNSIYKGISENKNTTNAAANDKTNKSVKSVCNSVNNDDAVSCISRTNLEKNFKSNEGKKAINIKEEDKISVYSHEKAIDRFEFDEKGEWNAIAEFNKEEFKQVRIKELEKEKELKRKTKEELLKQMQDVQNRKQNEKTIDKFYGQVTKKTVEKLTNEELEYIKIEKEKGLYEKKIRDEQLKENKNKIKKEKLIKREYEISLLNKVKKETEDEEKKQQRLKKEKHDELVKTLKENEEHKKILQERAEFDRQEDIKAQIEYSKMLDKQEKARADYFKERERKGNTFISLMIENVIKEQDGKNQKLDNTIKMYQDLKNKM
jgi:hypothetical protein